MNAAFVVRGMQEIKSLENVMRQRMAALSIAQWLPWPALAVPQTAVQFPKASYELRLLLFEHLYVSMFISNRS